MVDLFFETIVFEFHQRGFIAALNSVLNCHALFIYFTLLLDNILDAVVIIFKTVLIFTH